MKIFYVLLFVLVIFGCSKDEKKVSIIKESSQELEMISSYNEAYVELNKGDT